MNKPEQGTQYTSERAKRIYWRIRWVLQAIIVIVLALHIWRGDWQTSVIIGFIWLISLIPTFFSKRWNIHWPIEFDVMFIFVIVYTLLLGEIGEFYYKVPWWDKVIHTATGFMFALLGFLVIYLLNENPKIQIRLTPSFMAIFAFCFAMTLGVLWEFFEFGADQLTGSNTQKVDENGCGLHDTMWDLIVDAIGALTMSLIGFFYFRGMQKGTQKSIFMGMINEFVEENPKMFKDKSRKDDNDDQASG